MSVDEINNYDLASAALLSRPEVQVLSPDEERALLLEIDEFKKLLLESRRSGAEESISAPPCDEEVQEIVRSLLEPKATLTDQERRLQAIALRYNQIRTKLAMANLRLVAHVARKYRDRGISTSDLLQEGFCGLLKAIDRFDPAKETRLASYAVWWIRQALQRAVAAGAYPVRLNPRHLQQLARSTVELVPASKLGRKRRSSGHEATLRQIHSATRPPISLDARTRMDEGSSLMDTLTYPAQDESPSSELDEYLVVMLKELKPREQVVLQLRFGLGGRECHSLSQVSEVLDVSKERIRQIQEGALRKLRSMAREKVPSEVLG